MRLGASIILINGYCYQSYNWSYTRPLGSLEKVLSFLDKYEVDEICITRPIKGSDNLSVLANDLRAMRSSSCSSPLSFGGGIRSLASLKNLQQLPVERLHFSNAFFNMNSRLINKVKNQYGKQAIVASVPVKLVNGQLFFYDSPAKNFKILSNKIISYIKDNADEVLIIDTQNEGINNSFNFDILEAIDLPLNKLMITGGIGQKQISFAKDLGLISCLIDNRILHRENFMKREL